MDDPHKHSPQTSEQKNVLPDVVHSQQIPAIGAVVTDETESGISGQNVEQPVTDADQSDAESISEHIPSKVDNSTESDNAENTGLLTFEAEQEKVSKASSLNIPLPHSPASDNPSTQDPSKMSTSWPLAVSDIHLISEESPVNLPLSSDISKELTQENKSQTPKSPKSSEHDAPNMSPKSDNYLDSLNDGSSPKSNLSVHISAEKSDSSDKSEQLLNQESSGSEEIIKLDIRGQSAPKLPFPTAKIIFGPPPEGSTIIDSNIKSLPLFPNLLSPFLVGAGNSVIVEEVFDEPVSKKSTPEKSIEMSPNKESLSYKIEQSDLLIEEITVDDEIKEKESEKDEASIPPKSMPPEETMSFSTMTTDYKTICEEYNVKLVHLEDDITQRDELIEELTISLQRAVRERDNLRTENEHLTNEVGNLQHVIGERSQSDNDTVKAELSDFVKYQTLIKDDSTKFYSALMSEGSSLKSSNEEKDMDREEITINYSKSDLKSSDTSDDFQTGFETKLTTIINKFDKYIEENLRNKLRESLIQVLCNEIGKMRIENDTEIKELETQIKQDKQAYAIETRRLRELLASVKAGNADIEVLRQELSIKHEKEMENLRTYFEKKCSDMERSYSEEVWRGRCASPMGSMSSLEAADAAGDHVRRRTRSAELPSLSLESTQMEQAVKQISKKYEQQLEELKAEQVAYVSELQAKQREAVASLEEQIIQLKAHIQTTENTESNVSLYQQDIDLELEKKMETQLEQRLEEVRENVRQEVVNHLQEQLQWQNSGLQYYLSYRLDYYGVWKFSFSRFLYDIFSRIFLFKVFSVFGKLLT